MKIKNKLIEIGYFFCFFICIISIPAIFFCIFFNLTYIIIGIVVLTNIINFILNGKKAWSIDENII